VEFARKTGIRATATRSAREGVEIGREERNPKLKKPNIKKTQAEGR